MKTLMKLTVAMVLALTATLAPTGSGTAAAATQGYALVPFTFQGTWELVAGCKANEEPVTLSQPAWLTISAGEFRLSSLTEPGAVVSVETGTVILNGVEREACQVVLADGTCFRLVRNGEVLIIALMEGTGSQRTVASLFYARQVG